MVFHIPRVGFGKITLVLGPLDIFLHKLHRLLQFFILLGEGLHPLDQLLTLYDSSRYALQKHQDYKEPHSPTPKTDIIDAILTSICFMAMERVDHSLFTYLVVSSSSTTTTSSPHLRKLQMV